MWVTLDSAEQLQDGRFSRVFTWRFRFIVTSDSAPGAHVPMSFRTRDAAGFEAQRDTYVVAVP